MKNTELITKSAHRAAQEGLEFSNDQKRLVARGANKHLQILDHRLKSINLELVQTKNKIVQDVLQSRALEKTHQSVLAAHEALQAKVMQTRFPDYIERQQSTMIALQRDFSLNFTAQELESLIHLCRDIKLASLVVTFHEVLRGYKDRGVKSGLENCPLDPAQLTEDIFVQVAKSTSLNRISDYEARSLYAQTIGLSASPQSTPSSSPPADIIWQKLQRRILAKVRLLFLTEKGYKFLEEKEEEKRMHFKFSHIPSSPSTPLSPRTSKLNHVPLLSASVTLPLEKNSHATADKPQKRPPTMLASSQSFSDPLPPMNAPLHTLQKEFEKSQKKVAKMQEQLALNLAELYTSHKKGGKKTPAARLATPTTSSSSAPTPSLPPISLPSSAAVLQQFRNTAVQKVAQIVVPKMLHMLHRRLHVWRDGSKVAHTESDVRIFLKASSVLRLHRMCRWSLLARTARRFGRWRHVVSFLKSTEEFSAAVQIQRTYRGYVGRVGAKRAVTLRAAESIQRTFRVHCAQKFARRAMRRRLLRLSVRRIETMWQKFRWRRTLNKIFQSKRQNRSALCIQRVFRGHLGRKKYRAKLLKALMEESARRIQSVYRMYKAVLRVEARRLEKRRNDAATSIQKINRAYFVRKVWRVRWRRHQAAKTIQCFRRVCLAIREFTRRKRRFSATQIQRVARGRQGRARFLRLWEARRVLQAQILAKRTNSIRALEPVIVGHAARRRIKEPMSIHRNRRNQAARVLQSLFYALYLALKARRRVRQIRADNAELLRRKAAARQVQRIGRGYVARRRYNKLREEMMKVPPAWLKWPVYYKLKKRYFEAQDSLHHKPVAKIQALFRGAKCRKKAKLIVQHRASAKIVSFLRSSILILEAKSIKAEKFRQKTMKNFAIFTLQRIVRGGLVRIRMRRMFSLHIISWVAMEVKVRKKIAQALENFR